MAGTAPRRASSCTTAAADGVARRCALRGWIDRSRVRAARAARSTTSRCAASTQLLLDCSQLRHIDYRAGAARWSTRCRASSRAPAACVVCGLSHYLRDLFRLAGCESRLRCWPSAAELLATGGRERRA